MATKTLITRINQKIDTYARWQQSTLVLGKGEVAFATSAAQNGAGLTEPVIMMKVGDGEHTFAELPFDFYAKASDVPAWAKAEKPPVDKNTTYVFEIKDKNLVITPSEGNPTTLALATDAELKEVSDALASLTERVEALETTVGNLDTNYAAKEHDHVAADITDLDATIKTYDYATKTEAQGYANAKDTAIAEAKKAGDDAAAALETYKGEMTTALAGKQDVIPENTYDAYGAAANALNDAKTYTDEVKDALLGEGIKDTFDTLVEIQNWIEGDGVNATELTEAIAAEAKLRSDADAALQRAIDGIDNHTHTNKSELDLIATGDKAKWDAKQEALTETQLAAVNSGVTTSKVTAYDTHVANTTIHVTTADKEKWNAAEQNAKNHANTEIKKVTDVINTYGDIVTHDVDEFATAAQGALADSALQEVKAAAGGGLKVTNKNEIAIDESIEFIFNCGDSGVTA